MDYQGRQRFVNYYDIVENGNLVILGQINVSYQRECPNCFVMFKNNENRHYIIQQSERKVNFTNVRSVAAELKLLQKHVGRTDKRSVNSSRFSCLNSRRT